MTTNIRANESILLSPYSLKNQMSLRTDLSENIIKWRTTIINILKGKEHRLLVIIGPCSVHDPIAINFDGPGFRINLDLYSVTTIGD